MRNESERVLNHLLFNTFDLVLKTEQAALSKRRNGALTISEIHTIDAISESGLRSMSEIASDLDIAMATLTAAITKLERKGFVERKRTEEDRRVVLVQLTRKGRIVFREHRLYHERMVQATLKDLDPQEEKALISALIKLNDYFKNKQAIKAL